MFRMSSNVPEKHRLTGLRCEKCSKPIEENNKRTHKGHPDCFPDLPVLTPKY